MMAKVRISIACDVAPLEGFGPQDRDLGLKAGIWALGLWFGPVLGGGGTKKEEEKEKEEEEEKIPHLFESIGYRGPKGKEDGKISQYVKA